MKKTIGILGGMGPFATADLFQKIVENTPAEVDQEHPRILIYNNPKIPPRLLTTNQSTSPLPELIKSATLLQDAGADFLIMPCHTAHIWYEEVKNKLTIPFYSLIENTVKMTEQLYGNTKNHNLLLLATESTINSQMYQREFGKTGFTVFVPTKKEQMVVDQAIKSFKGGKISANNPIIHQLNQIINSYHKNGVSLLLGCCTEIPLMYRYFQTEMELIDPTLLLAIMAINKSQDKE